MRHTSFGSTNTCPVTNCVHQGQVVSQRENAEVQPLVLTTQTAELRRISAHGAGRSRLGEVSFRPLESTVDMSHPAHCRSSSKATLPGGTSLVVTVTRPGNGAVVNPGSLAVEGSVDLGDVDAGIPDAGAPSTTVVYAI